MIDEKKDGHAYGKTVGNLIQDDAVGAVSNLTFHFQAPVNRSRVHDDGVTLCRQQSFFAKTVELKVFLLTG